MIALPPGVDSRASSEEERAERVSEPDLWYILAKTPEREDDEEPFLLYRPGYGGTGRTIVGARPLSPIMEVSSRLSVSRPSTVPEAGRPQRSQLQQLDSPDPERVSSQNPFQRRAASASNASNP